MPLRNRSELWALLQRLALQKRPATSSSSNMSPSDTKPDGGICIRPNERLKPGGYRPNVGHPEGYWAPAIGNAHLIDVVEGHAAGEAPLQQQIRMMFDMLHYDLDTEILSLNYVPFRCTDWESLPHEGEALLLGERLWEWVIHQLDCPLIVCFGKSVLENRIAGSVGARFVEDIPTGWGNICASIYEYGKLGRLVSLPHLSRFKIFGRSEFTEVDRVFGPQHLKKG
jgi:hypothetical protein